MWSVRALLKLCRIIYQWYTEGALCTHLLPLMVVFNMIVLCLLFLLKQLIAAGVAYWRHQRRPHKGPDFIYNLEECPICFQPFCDPVRLHCGHVNCLECISSYCRLMPYAENYKCSLCREPIRGILYLDGYAPSRMTRRRKQMKLAELRKMMSLQRKEIWYTNPYASTGILAMLTTMMFMMSVYYVFY